MTTTTRRSISSSSVNRLISKTSSMMMFLIIILLLLLFVVTVDGAKNDQYCDLREETIYTVYYDTETGMYIPSSSSSKNNNNNRTLFSLDNNNDNNKSSITEQEHNDNDTDIIKSSWLSLSSIVETFSLLQEDDDEEEAIAMIMTDNYSRQLQEQENDNESITLTENLLRVRKCTCAERFQTSDKDKQQSYYCPLENNYCYIPKKYGAGGLSSTFRPPNCLNTNGKKYSYVRSMWPIVITLFGLLTLCGVCTLRGNFALTFLISKCFKRFNKGYVRFILTEHPLRSRKMIRNWCIRRRQEIEDQYITMLQEQGSNDDNENNNNNNSDGQSLRNNNSNSNHDNAVIDGMQLDHIEEALVRGEPNKEKQQQPPKLLLKTRIYKDSEEKFIHDGEKSSEDVSSSSSSSSDSDDDDDNNSNSNNKDSNTGNDTTTSQSSDNDNNNELEEEEQENPNNKSNRHINDANEHNKHNHHHNHARDAISAIPVEDDNDDDDPLEYYHVACTICFGPIHDGDRVGALPCHHTFHVECLKVWIKRRNVCPLCLKKNIAKKVHHNNNHHNNHNNTTTNTTSGT